MPNRVGTLARQLWGKRPAGDTHLQSTGHVGPATSDVRGDIGIAPAAPAPWPPAGERSFITSPPGAASFVQYAQNTPVVGRGDKGDESAAILTERLIEVGVNPRSRTLEPQRAGGACRLCVSRFERSDREFH
jgi:hypothetical protein